MKKISYVLFLILYFFNTFSCSGTSYDVYAKRLAYSQYGSGENKGLFFNYVLDGIEVTRFLGLSKSNRSESKEKPLLAFKLENQSIKAFFKFISFGLRNNRGVLRIRKNSNLTGGSFTQFNQDSSIKINKNISKFSGGDIVFNYFLGGVNSDKDKETSNNGVLLNFSDKEFYTLSNNESYLFTLEPEDKNTELFLTIGWQEV